MSAPSDLFVERCWLIECSRCANEGSSFEPEVAAAQRDFDGAGWIRQSEDDQLCPRCAEAIQ